LIVSIKDLFFNDSLSLRIIFFSAPRTCGEKIHLQQPEIDLFYHPALLLIRADSEFSPAHALVSKSTAIDELLILNNKG